MDRHSPTPRWPTTATGARLLIAPPITRCVSDAPPHQFQQPSTADDARAPDERGDRDTAAVEPSAAVEAQPEPAAGEPAGRPVGEPRAARAARRSRRSRRPHVAGGGRVLMLGVALTSTFMLTAAMAAADVEPAPAPPAPTLPADAGGPVVGPHGP